MYLLGVKFRSETAQIQNLNFVKLNVPGGWGRSWEMENLGFDSLQIADFRGEISFHSHFLVSLQVLVSKSKENAFKRV